MHVKETCKHSKETDTCLKEIYTRSQETIYIERKSLRECVCVCVCVCVSVRAWLPSTLAQKTQ